MFVAEKGQRENNEGQKHHRGERDARRRWTVDEDGMVLSQWPQDNALLPARNACSLTDPYE